MMDGNNEGRLLRRQTAERVLQTLRARGVLQPAGPHEAVRSLEAAINASFPDEPVVVEPAQPTGNGWLIGFPEPAGFPSLSPSIVYLEDGAPRVAVCMLLPFGEVCSAALGLGTSLEGRPISVAAPQPPGHGITVNRLSQATAPPVPELVRRLAGWRLPQRDSVLAPLLYIAAGRIDAYAMPWPTDAPGRVMCGSLLVTEAAGYVAGSEDAGALLAAAGRDALGKLQSALTDVA